MTAADNASGRLDDEQCSYLVHGLKQCRAQPVVADLYTSFGRERWPLCEEHTKPTYHPAGVKPADREHTDG